jgi:hypothetical protein
MTPIPQAAGPRRRCASRSHGRDPERGCEGSRKPIAALPGRRGAWGSSLVGGNACSVLRQQTARRLCAQQLAVAVRLCALGWTPPCRIAIGPSPSVHDGAPGCLRRAKAAWAFVGWLPLCHRKVGALQIPCVRALRLLALSCKSFVRASSGCPPSPVCDRPRGEARPTAAGSVAFGMARLRTCPLRLRIGCRGAHSNIRPAQHGEARALWSSAALVYPRRRATHSRRACCPPGTHARPPPRISSTAMLLSRMLVVLLLLLRPPPPPCPGACMVRRLRWRLCRAATNMAFEMPASSRWRWFRQPVSRTPASCLVDRSCLVSLCHRPV